MTVAEARIVVIAAADLLPALQARSESDGAEVLAFPDRDAVRALEEIVKRRPHTVALERQFAATPRGTALINRIKNDPALAGCELRVITLDGDDARVVRRAAAAPAGAPGGPGGPGGSVTLPPAVPVSLDQRGTRRAPRVRIAGEINMLVDGSAARLVDLSTVGAQVISPTILKPNQRVRLTLSDERGVLRFNGAVAWAFFEIPPGRGPQFRAGISFTDADGKAVDAFGLRHTQ